MRTISAAVTGIHVAGAPRVHVQRTHDRYPAEPRICRLRHIRISVPRGSDIG